MLFAREPLDPATLGRPEAGVFVLRLAEISERPALLRRVIRLYDQFVQEGWQALLDVEKAPEIHLNDDRVCGRSADDDAQAQDDGADGTAQLLRRGVHYQVSPPVAWKSWTLSNVAGAREVHEEAFDYVTLPTIGRFADLHFCVAARDEQTIVISANVDRLRELVDERVASGHAQAPKWVQLDGGLLAFLGPVKVEGSPASAATIRANCLIRPP